MISLEKKLFDYRTDPYTIELGIGLNSMNSRNPETIKLNAIITCSEKAEPDESQAPSKR